MSVICVVQARTGSSRLPGKVLMDVGGRPMLEFMLDRLARLRVDELVLATTTLERDDPVAEVAQRCGRPVVRGSEADVLSRYAAALAAHPADHVIRLTADCPLADPELVEMVSARHLERDADYTCNVLPRSFPKGLDVEVVRAEALLRAHEEARDPAEREHVTPFLYRRPERFRLANVTTTEALGRERWTVDTSDDLEFVRRAVAAVGDPHAGWRDIFAVVGRSVVPPAGRVWLRPALMSDGPALMAWKNDPTAVRYSVSGRAVTPAEHEAWLAARCGDAATRIWIGEIDGGAIGEVRVDAGAGRGLVSVAVAPEHRGRGHGRELLAALREELVGDLQVCGLEAHIHLENTASLRAFEAVGFVRAGSVDGFDRLLLDY